MSETSEVTVKIPRCMKFTSVVALFQILSTYTSTSSEALSVQQIYNLHWAKAQLKEIEIFNNIPQDQLLTWMKFTHRGSRIEAKNKFITWLDLSITNMETECQNRGLDREQITMGDFWKAIDLHKYRLSLMSEIKVIEDIPIAYEKKKEEDRKREEELEQQRLKAIELAKAKHLEEKQKKASSETKWITSKKQYYLRCQNYLRCGYDSHLQDEASSPTEIDSEDLDIDEMKSVIKEAHEKHNDDLVKYKTFPGCHYFGLGCECDDDNCYWTVDMHRCSCDNYKGFTFNTEGVNWLEDTSLDATSPRGCQERQW
jgi:hypothetical protein